MNVYIASFMLLLFNAAGVTPPASALAAETTGNEAVSDTEWSISADWTDAANALVQSAQPVATVFNGHGNADILWSVSTLKSSIGDKLEHEEGAP